MPRGIKNYSDLDKVALYEEVLHKIASWKQGNHPMERDEPFSSEEARQVLRKTRAAPIRRRKSA